MKKAMGFAAMLLLILSIPAVATDRFVLIEMYTNTS